MQRRVVVTGMGIVAAQALDIKTFSWHLQKGISGEGPIRRFDTTNFPVKTAFEVKNFDARSYHAYMMDPFIQYAVAAAVEAVAEAKLDIPQIDPYRIGISVSSSKGGVHTMHQLSERFRKSPSAILGARIYANSVPNFAAQWIARRWKIHGPAKCYVAACATGTVAVAEGARMVREGTVDYCFAGASDASIVPLMLAGYYQMKALSRGTMNPFDKRRQGFLVGEGAGILMLETLESARARNAVIYGEILGASYGSDGTDMFHFKEKNRALSYTLEKLLKGCELSLGDIGYINLHGTATQPGDLYETNQIKEVFGKRAYAIPMSSIKSMTGHMLGASGAVEIIASLLAMKDDFIPPTIGLEKPDPACDLNYTPKKSVKAKIQTALSLSMGFGGHVAAIALRKV